MDLLTLELIAAQTPGVPITDVDGTAVHAACLLAVADRHRFAMDSIARGLANREQTTIAYAVQHCLVCHCCGCNFTGGAQWTV